MVSAYVITSHYTFRYVCSMVVVTKCNYQSQLSNEIKKIVNLKTYPLENWLRGLIKFKVNILRNYAFHQAFKLRIYAWLSSIITFILRLKWLGCIATFEGILHSHIALLVWIDIVDYSAVVRWTYTMVHLRWSIDFYYGIFV